ncbi:L-threonylcarbamoyladenylate synthase [Desulfonatronum thiodismutans]|uniref:L-threonylcarbamoyladenylate synthase n=1 Tax=Desulfonatronum thiodismutans TaxID=159290 RepID=UPI0004ABE22A|nr:L-threonylcarbamoyladenylate synthase [Desulfonatronum thiodismutans]
MNSIINGQHLQQELVLAAKAITRGELVVYPTETLYALGADIQSPDAVQRVFQAKGRPQGKPLPVLIGAPSQLAMVTDHRDALLDRLIIDFWPGPLSILVPARAGLSPLLQDQHGFIAVRWTSHPTAQALALQSSTPLTATSANTSGQPAASRPERLDPKLTATLITETSSSTSPSNDEAVNHNKNMILRQPPYPGGGAPSTVVRIMPDGHLKIFRLGAIGLKQLEQAGWNVG